LVEIFPKIVEKYGSIDVLVNNAGVNSRITADLSQVMDWVMADYDKCISDIEKRLSGFRNELGTNLVGPYLTSYIAANYMARNDSDSSIINISSIKGKEPTSSPGYGASKAGLIKLTRDCAKAFAQYDIRVNCVAPGFIDCGLTSELSDEKKTAYKKMIPMARFGQPREIAKVVSFLASEDASYITGATIDVNGGYLMD
jgi:3-oxoacyl-[acyl-carrier protein] reductase